jgi:hypothetical protein
MEETPSQGTEKFDSIPQMISTLLFKSGEMESFVASWKDKEGFIHSGSFGNSKLECLGLANVLSQWMAEQLTWIEEEEEGDEDE